MIFLPPFIYLNKTNFKILYLAYSKFNLLYVKSKTRSICLIVINHFEKCFLFRSIPT